MCCDALVFRTRKSDAGIATRSNVTLYHHHESAINATLV